jgi:DNA-directed RNA polymerase specialized sigma24 family protein
MSTDNLNQWKTEWAALNAHAPDETGAECGTCHTSWPCAVEVEARDTEGHVTWADTGSGGGYTPEDQVARLRQARQDLDTVERVLVAEMRVSGWSWQDIGDLYGITRQAAHQRFRPA